MTSIAEPVRASIVTPFRIGFAGVVLGALAGTRVLVRLPNRAVRRFFLVVLAVLGVEMVWRGLAGMG